MFWLEFYHTLDKAHVDFSSPFVLEDKMAMRNDIQLLKFLDS